MEEEINQIENLLEKQQKIIDSQIETISNLQVLLNQAETRIAELQAEMYSKRYQ